MSGEAFSEEGLRVLHDRLAAHLEHGAMPRYVALVASGGRVWVDVVGAKAFEKSDPMQRDDIFRIASLTKPIAAVGALVLVERGVLRLDEPVDGEALLSRVVEHGYLLIGQVLGTCRNAQVGDRFHGTVYENRNWIFF